jgi:hypothetical protein
MPQIALPDVRVIVGFAGACYLAIRFGRLVKSAQRIETLLAKISERS